jgi:hypothetical protein
MSNLHAETLFKKIVLDEDLSSTESLYIKAIQASQNHTTSITELKKFLSQKQTDLKNKINKLDINLRASLLSSKKFINEAYALNLPLTSNLFINEVVVLNGVLTPSLELSTTEKIDMDFKNFNSEYGTKFKISNNNIVISKNQSEQFQQLSINIPKDIYSGFFCIKFETDQLLSILDKNNAEIVSKTFTNILKIPFDKDTIKLKLRFFDNNQRVIKIVDKFFTKLVYTQKQVYETKTLVVNKILTQLALNTCDNYSNNLVNIKYYLKINNEDYKEIKPLNKDKISNVPNILKSSSQTYTEKLTNYIVTNGAYYYPVSSINNLTNIICLEREIREISQFSNKNDLVTCYTYNSNPVQLILSENDEVVLNDVSIIANVDNYVCNIPVGINKLALDKYVFNQPTSFLNAEIVNVKEGVLLTYTENSITKSINLYDEKSICLQLLKAGCELYESRPVFELIYIDDIKYIVKDNRNNPKIFGTSLNNNVQSVQLKIELESLDSKTIPYVSSITVKGA